MQLGMAGLGRVRGHIVQRPMRSPANVSALATRG
jgi:hypothetical protein